MRAIAGLWRWRNNPLRRGTDLAEARVALVALLLVLVAAPVVGCLVGFLAQDALQQSVREQGSSRHPVTATVVQRLNRLDPDPEITTGRDPRSRVLADWTAPDGTRRHGPVTTTLRSPRPGDHFTLWTDEHGRTVTRPLDSTTATAHAVLAGCGAGMLTALLVEGIRRLIVWRLDRRRDALWDQAWDRAGPDWGRTGTGS
ncbi:MULTISPECIES: hypothetical protein [unclassified Streptomyces]|uniref:Rv1733c family protein n=1 Tax=unclassified Streptomyces TaxID=2593676 RepID=UPI000C27F46E|nr:hypothetical protein [Streptomyces sp. CB01373]PJM96814.1 hypothetical protein CG719_06525 [Streptomyces sp. CB01373]